VELHTSCFSSASSHMLLDGADRIKSPRRHITGDACPPQAADPGLNTELLRQGEGGLCALADKAPPAKPLTPMRPAAEETTRVAAVLWAHKPVRDNEAATRDIPRPAASLAGDISSIISVPPAAFRTNENETVAELFKGPEFRDLFRRAENQMSGGKSMAHTPETSLFCCHGVGL
jgi:hypothetical protein